MDIGVWMKWLHVVAAFGMVAGIFGRAITHGLAKASDNLQGVSALLHASEIFDQWFVIPFSGLVIVLGLTTAWVQGWPILGRLQGGGVDWLFVSLLLTLTLIPLVAFVLAPRRAERRQALSEATAAGEVTPSLRAALDDRGVAWGRAYELVTVTVIVALMVLKPF